MLPRAIKSTIISGFVMTGILNDLTTRGVNATWKIFN